MLNEINSSNPLPSGVAGQPLDPQSVEGIFIEALGKAAGQPRRDFIDSACQRNAELRTRVEALLRAYDDAGSFLQQPAADWRNPPITAAAGSPVAPEETSDHGIPAGLLRPSDIAGVLGTIGPYQVRELIGRGGMGIVMRAFDAKLNRVVAIKALTPELAAQPTARRRFLREAQAAAAVTHPHVVTIHAVDEDEWPYLVMECIDGRSLQDKIEQSGTLKLAEVLRIGTQIAEGLTAAHKQGLIHRDVKPANVLLENGVERVKITDFGLAKAADDLTITRPGEISGTPQYMSPEQASGQRVDQRSDLFSLGCVLYAMCAGRPPFRAESMAAIVKKICEDTPQPLGEIDPDVPDWLAAIIDRLLAKDPNERFQTADEVARLLGDALARLQAGQAVSASVVTQTMTSKIARRSHRQFSLRLLLIAVAIVAIDLAIGRFIMPEGDRHDPSVAWIGPVVIALAALAAILACVAIVRMAIVAYEATREFGNYGERLFGVSHGQTSAVSVPAEAQPGFPAWLLTPLPLAAWLAVVFTAMAGYWFGRFVPTGRSEGWWFASALVISGVLMFFQVRCSRIASSTAAAIFVAVGIVAFLAAGGIGHDELVRHQHQFDSADGLAVAASLLVTIAIWRAIRRPAVTAVAAGVRRPSPARQPWTRQPWKLAGWLVVALLAFVLIVPLVALVGVLIPAYQAAQSRDDMRRQMANWGHLKLTFDEDLPIVDIQIDGTTCGPIEISPVERAWSAGSHTVTVVYTHGARKRSVRTTVDVAPQKEQALDLTALVERDMQERKKLLERKWFKQPDADH